MRKLFITICVLFITACSTTHIHVHTVGIDQSTQQQLLKSLDAAGFKTHLGEYQLPPLKEGSYVIHAPDPHSTQQFQTIEHILSSLHLPPPESRPFSLGEGISAHRYTKGNIGLYVIANPAQ